jgi:hypothetical protein
MVQWRLFFLGLVLWIWFPQMTTGCTLYIVIGYNLVSCPYVRGQNTLGELGFTIPNSTFFKFDNASQTWQRADFDGISWQPNLRLLPGEGGFLKSPVPAIIELTGDLQPPVLPVVIPTNRWYLLSRQADDIGTYSNIVGLPPYEGVGFAPWMGVGYRLNEYANGSWVPGDTEPTIGPCTAVWIGTVTPGTVPSVPGNPEGPTIPGQPQDCTIAAGSDAIFSVSASGPQPYTYQWYFNGKAVDGATEAQYTRRAAQAADAGRYFVVVSNTVASLRSADAFLTVTSTSPFAVTIFGFTNSQFGFSVANPSRQTVVIQASSNLFDWVSLQTNRSGDSTVYFLDTQPATAPAKWYRAQLLP